MGFAPAASHLRKQRYDDMLEQRLTKDQIRAAGIALTTPCATP
jgi:hypothetical protein